MSFDITNQGTACQSRADGVQSAILRIPQQESGDFHMLSRLVVFESEGPGIDQVRNSAHGLGPSTLPISLASQTLQDVNEP